MFVLIGIEITFFGVGLCILQAVEMALERHRRMIPGVLFYLFNAMIMFGVAMTGRGVPQQYPWAIFLFMTSLFMIGPLNLFYYHTLLYHDTPLPYRTWAHLLPGAASFVLEIIFQILPHHEKKEILSAFFTDPLHHLLTLPLAAASFHVFVYVFIIMKTMISDINISESRREFRFFLYVAVGIIMVIAFLLAGFLTGNAALFVCGSVINVMIHISLYIVTRTYPQFFTAWKKEIKKKRYERSMLTGIDTSIIRDRLDDLMRDEGPLPRQRNITIHARGASLPHPPTSSRSY